ncbi:protein yellow-like [Neodiprion pinetum]|uniref:protein yellow-like n=1 Tax=Neodiprion pinetum TaxID=441929 RepID=UPI001EDD7AA2|nr:protein yellow-like [Neodiprion pinetum]
MRLVVNYGHATVFILVLLTVQSAKGINNLQVVYQWKLLEYAWPNEDTQLLFSHYVQANNNPLGLEVAGDRLFITIPRWKPGVVATLNYVYLNDTSESPLLNPYPSWEAHEYGNNSVPEIVSTFRIWADKCDRLWVLDMGVEDLTGTREQLVTPSLIIYDLTTDQLLRNYAIPSDQYPEKSHFGNVVVEDAACNDSFAYLAELQGPGIIVYSWASNDSWLVEHHYFHPDPLAGNFNVSGLSFQWWDGVVNLALAPEEDGYSTLYFHPLCSNAEFSVSTELLRDSVLATSSDSFHNFTVVGTRGINGQGAASYLDQTTGILFHALSIANAVSCWNPGTSYSLTNVARVYADNTTLVFPADIKIDNHSNIWVLSDRLPTFMYDQLDPDQYNFRVLSGSVEEAIEGTVCSRGATHSGVIQGLVSHLIVVILVWTCGTV